MFLFINDIFSKIVEYLRDIDVIKLRHLCLYTFIFPYDRQIVIARRCNWIPLSFTKLNIVNLYINAEFIIRQENFPMLKKLKLFGIIRRPLSIKSVCHLILYNCHVTSIIDMTYIKSLICINSIIDQRYLQVNDCKALVVMSNTQYLLDKFPNLQFLHISQFYMPEFDKIKQLQCLVYLNIKMVATLTLLNCLPNLEYLSCWDIIMNSRVKHTRIKYLELDVEYDTKMYKYKQALPNLVYLYNKHIHRQAFLELHLMKINHDIVKTYTDRFFD